VINADLARDVIVNHREHECTIDGARIVDVQRYPGKIVWRTEDEYHDGFVLPTGVTIRVGSVVMASEKFSSRIPDWIAPGDLLRLTYQLKWSEDGGGDVRLLRESPPFGATLEISFSLGA
jgi:hypothetical protein